MYFFLRYAKKLIIYWRFINFLAYSTYLNENKMNVKGPRFFLHVWQWNVSRISNVVLCSISYICNHIFSVLNFHPYSIYAKNSYDICIYPVRLLTRANTGGPVIRCVIIIFSYKNMCGLFNILYTLYHHIF